MGAGRKLCLWFLANIEVQMCSALAAMSILGVVIVCPIILDPAIETLVSSFDDGMCQAIYAATLQGVSNCTWTSCREGCTAEIYSCTQILVLYVHGTREALFSDPSNSSVGWDLPALNYSFALARDLNLSSIYDSLVDAMTDQRGFGIGALFPNPQGCIYPTDMQCSDFNAFYGNLNGTAFPCFISGSNATLVVTTVDRMGALRNIFLSLVPLACALAIFTYLFYQVGLIGKKHRRAAKDEEALDFSSGTPERTLNGSSLVRKGGQPLPRDSTVPQPGIQKKLRKKFLPKRDNSSKKRRKGKIFNKKNLLQVKQQLSIRSPGSSIGGRAPSMSMTSDDFIGSFSNTHTTRHSIQPV